MPTRTLRLSDDLDALMRVAAADRGESVHAWLVEGIREQLQRQAARAKDGSALAAKIKRIGWTHGEKS